MTDLAQEAYAAALAGLDRMTWSRLDVLLSHASPRDAFAMVCGDESPRGLAAHLFDVDGLAAAWRQSAAQRSPDRVWEQCCESGISVVVRGGEGYPVVLANDPAPAPVLFIRGNLDQLAGRRVGVVGTRNATGAHIAACSRLLTAPARSLSSRRDSTSSTRANTEVSGRPSQSGER